MRQANRLSTNAYRPAGIGGSNLSAPHAPPGIRSLVCRCISVAIHSPDDSLRHLAAHPCCARGEGQCQTVLREGESLTQFIERRSPRAEFRAEQDAAVARAKKALHAVPTRAWA